MAGNKPFTLSNLRGGLNDFDPPTSLAPDQCMVAENVEFFKSTLGERRRGSLAIDIPTGLSTKEMVTFLYRHLPTTDEADAELWSLGVSLGLSVTLQRKDTTYHSVTMADPLTNSGTYPFTMVGQTLHGKLFLAYKSGVNRLHVWDGTTLRRVGLDMPVTPPTAVDTGVGTLSATRYYRVRFTTKSGLSTLLRSEPSDALTFSPSTTGASITVTRPTLINEGETHWELEASLDNVNFYVLATTPVATTDVIDTTTAVTGYSDLILSGDIGDYTVPHSGEFLSVDRDRLLIGGSHDDSTLSSRFSWTTVFADPGDGNDERIPIDTDNFIDLDTFEGGKMTGMSGPIDGSVYCFKWSHIYKCTSTGQRERAYEAKALTKQRGAIKGSLVEGVDEAGRACLYFLDPKVGPCRIGPSGLVYAGHDIRNTWSRVNTNATQVISRGIFYPESSQIRWNVAVDGSDTPNLGLTLQINETQSVQSGLRRGWTIFTGPSTEALSMCLFSTNIDANTSRSIDLKPFIGKADSIGNHIQMLDVGDDDNGTEYSAHITTRPYVLSALTNQFSMRAGALLAKSSVGGVVRVTLIKDFGLAESEAKDINLDPHDDEAHVIVQMDDLIQAELYAVQVDFQDPEVPGSRWELSQLDLTPTAGQSN